jgi:3-hydroxy-3-methylglutaryl CoA synthase
MLAASIKSTWHYANVRAELALSVAVSVSPQKLKRASQTKVIKVNNYVTECSRFIDAVRTAAQIVSLLPEQRQKLAAMARELQLQDPLAEMDLVEACSTARVALVTAEMMVRSSLGKLNNSGEST